MGIYRSVDVGCSTGIVNLYRSKGSLDNIFIPMLNGKTIAYTKKITRYKKQNSPGA
jgi:hypothetical protein